MTGGRLGCLVGSHGLFLSSGLERIAEEVLGSRESNVSPVQRARISVAGSARYSKVSYGPYTKETRAG